MLRSEWDALSPSAQRHVAKFQSIENDPVELSDTAAREAADRAEYEKALKRGFDNLTDTELSTAKRWFPNLKT